MTDTIDELAIRLARAHYTRTKGDEAPFTSIDSLRPLIASVWRTMALSVQDVLGVEGVAHAMAAMDNIANSTSSNDRIREGDVVLLRPLDAVRNVFGGGDHDDSDEAS